MSNVKFQLIGGPAAGSIVEVDEFSREINVFEAITTTTHVYRVFKICWPLDSGRERIYFFAHHALTENRRDAEKIAISMIASGQVGHTHVFGGSA